VLSALVDMVRAPAAESGPGWTVPTEAESFPEQWSYENSRALYNAVCCSRRAGKTTGAVRRHAALHAQLSPGSWTHFGSLIRRNARKHFWEPLKATFDRCGIAYEPNNTEMILRTQFGTYCQAFGCDDEAGTKAVQGDGSMLFTIDECHLPNDDILRKLVDVATPMLTDNGGMLDLLGLPPEVEGGFFSEVLDGGGFAVFGWTMFDHDFPRPREEKLADVIERCRRRGLPVEVTVTQGPDGRPRVTMVADKTHPIVARQYFGKRVKDPSTVAYEYVSPRNDYDPRAVTFGEDARHSLGLDLGFQDFDAMTVLGWRRTDADRGLYARWQWRRNHLDVDDLALVVRVVLDVFRPGFIVGDHGGHGAVKVLETLKNRMGIVIQPKPADVMVSVGLVNDDLRTARLKFPTEDIETPRLIEAAKARYKNDDHKLRRCLELLEPDGTTFQVDAGKVQKSVNPRTRKIEINKKGFHSDLTESTRYAHHAARHWAAKAPKPAPDIHERRDRAWLEGQRRIANPW